MDSAPLIIIMTSSAMLIPCARVVLVYIWNQDHTGLHVWSVGTFWFACPLSTPLAGGFSSSPDLRVQVDLLIPSPSWIPPPRRWGRGCGCTPQQCDQDELGRWQEQGRVAEKPHPDSREKTYMCTQWNSTDPGDSLTNRAPYISYLWARQILFCF